MFIRLLLIHAEKFVGAKIGAQMKFQIFGAQISNVSF
jgi:hypothetical protein